MNIGANYTGNGKCEFVVWAPLLKDVTLKLMSPAEQSIFMKQDTKGYWVAKVENVLAETLYLYRLENGKDRPDPASHFQPKGVHGPSQVIDHDSFEWEDVDWKGIPLAEMIMYELHIGTFTPEGTFDAAMNRINDLKDLGIDTIEIMPVAQFHGERNWGYDGTYPFAVQNSYGGPEGFKRFINECHKKGVAVILDVVYNHLGPEGNYLWDYGPYFTDKYKTPWGVAVNFDDAFSNEVRNFFIENALHWFKNYHIDALRLDAVHGISDFSARPFLQELAERIEELSSLAGRKIYLIAESDLNDSKIIRPRELGGYGIDAQWCDDFHHSIHTLLTGEKDGYYIDFGRIEHLVKSLREGFVYSGGYSEYRKRNHGNSSNDRPADQFIVFSQNHDQVGNRMLGERLTNIASFESLKLAAGTVLLSPYIPLLFMGEEYGEDAPFLYFVSHSDPGLIEAVREGRKEEFKAFAWKGESSDPQDAETFLKSKIRWEKRHEGKYKILLDFYKNLSKLRRNVPALSNLDKESLVVYGFEEARILFIRRWKNNSQVFCIFNFNREDTKFSTSLPEENWRKLLDSSDLSWEGPGSLLPESISGGKEVLSLRRHSFVIYSRERCL
jgi:maltooligosyltrehalose trehalohydrolase